MKHILFFSLLIFTKCLLAQAVNNLTLSYRLCNDCNEADATGEQTLSFNTLREYADETRTFLSRDVTSDYGPRDAGESSSWHKGVDFRPYEKSIQAPESELRGTGTILYNPYNNTAVVTHIIANGNYKVLGLKRPEPDTTPPISMGHIFHKQLGVPLKGLRTGNFVLKKLEVPNNRYYAIIDLSRREAFSNINGATVKLLISAGDTLTLTTTNHINPNQAVAPMGRSEAANLPAHLHLDMHSSISPADPPLAMVTFNQSKTNRYDPLHLVTHDMPEYEVSLKTRTSATNATPIPFTAANITYPGTSPTRLMVRAKMMDAARPTPPSTDSGGVPGSQLLGANGAYFKYSNVVYNVDDVEILLKGKADTAFATIRGPRVESRFSHGGRPTSSLYPFDTSATAVSPYDLNGVNVTSTVRIYQDTTVWNRYGIRPHAYRDFNGFPYDEYFYPAFITRIHREAPLASNSSPKIAHRPSDARYNDGPYQMMAKVTTVRDSIFTSDTLDFVLDNFKPYVEQVQLNAGNNMLYRRAWVPSTEGACTGIRLGFAQGSGSTITLSDVLAADFAGLIVEADASEAMAALTLDVVYTNMNGNTVDTVEIANIQPFEVYSNREIFRFRVPGDHIISLLKSPDVKFKFFGHDYATPPNYLLSFTDDHLDDACVSLPTRLSNTAWSNNTIPTGADLVHKTCFSCGTGGRTACSSDHYIIIAHNDCHRVAGSITPVSAGQTNGAISLEVEGTFDIDYTYSWSTGSTEANLSNLSPGTYTVTVSDGLCCEVVESFVVGDCAGLNFQVSGRARSPSACNRADGSIRIYSINTSGGTPPYTYHWEKDGAPLAVAPTTTGVLPGIYCFVATDAAGCQAQECYELLFEGMPEILGANIVDACNENSASGSIEVVVNIQSAADNFTFSWNTGHTSTGITGLLNGLLPGSYTVSVVNNELPNCPVVITYEVGDADLEVLPITSETLLLHPCPEKSNGEIRVNYEGGLAPYDILWSDGQDYSFERRNLPMGTYCYTITDRCGTATDGCVDLVPLEVLAIAESGCGGGSLSAIPQGGNPPYSFLWSTGATQQALNGVSSGNYTVVVKDRAGCEVESAVVQLMNQELEIVDTEAACIGINNGEIALRISNPNEELALLFVDDNIVIPSGDFSNQTIDFTIDQLLGGRDYAIKVVLGDCSLTDTVTVGQDPLDLELEHVVNNEYCVLNRVCDGEVVAEESDFAPILWERMDFQNGPFRKECEQDGYCSNDTLTVVATRSADRIRMPLPIYRLWLEMAASARLIEGSFFTEEGGVGFWAAGSGEDSDMCRMVRVCPYVVHAVGDGWFLSGGTGEIFPAECGRTYLCPDRGLFNSGGVFNECDIISELFDAWGLDLEVILDTPGAPSFTIPTGCDLQTANVRQLLYWRADMVAHYGEAFASSTLNSFLLEVQNSPSRLERATCASVTYCRNNFTFYRSDIDQIDCNRTVQSSGGSEVTVVDGDTIILPAVTVLPWCYQRPNFENGRQWYRCGRVTNYFTQVFDPEAFENFVPNEAVAFLPTPDQMGDLFFENMAFLEHGGHYSTKMFVKDTQGNPFYADFSPKSRHRALSVLENNEVGYYENLDNETELVLRKTSDNTYAVHFYGEEEQTLELESDGPMQLDYTFVEGDVVVFGAGLGKISINSNLACGSSGSVFHFALKLKSGGYELLYAYKVANENQLAETDFKYSRMPNFWGRMFASSTVQFSTGEEIMLGANSFFTLDGLNKTSTSFAASNGAIMKDAQQVDATASKMLIQENETLSACLINDGQAAWQFSIAADQGIIYDEQLLDIGGKQTLVAITFDGNLTIDGEVVESHGGRDILFVLLDQEGNLVGSKHYGSVHDEDVKQVVYKNGFVHFGGNYSGPTPMRQIGSLNFLQGPDWRLESFPIATYNRPYLSYISLESFETKKESQNDLERISNLQGQQPYDLTVEVIPNPTTGLLWLKIDADMQISSDLQILDATGKEVYRQQLSIAAQATETLQLDLSAQPNGLYFYRILGENTIYSSGKIVLQKTN